MAFQEEELSDGVYAAIFFPVNGKITNEVTGRIRLSKFGDDFRVLVNISKAPTGIHEQILYNGTACPTYILDKNTDGYLDFSEVEKNLGSILIPFDDDLSSRHTGLYPAGRSYRYEQSTSYQLLMSEIADGNGKHLQLENKVVMIFTPRSDLPGSVAGERLPLACGILTKISNDPAEDSWQAPPTDSTPVPPRPPRPVPPGDSVETKPPPPAPSNWWERWRERFERWRERVRDWWRSEN